MWTKRPYRVTGAALILALTLLAAADAIPAAHDERVSGAVIKTLDADQG